MPRTFEGHLVAGDARFAVVVSRFNDFITRPMLEGALDAARRHGGDAEAVDVAWCPGAFEIPVVARKLAESGRYDAVIALGAVIRGATDHYDFVAGGVTNGILNVMQTTGVPVMFGVITVDTIEQAIERAGSKAGNKGAEAMLAAIETVSLLRAIEADEPDHQTTRG